MEQGEITTTDLADFGYREIKETIELLDMWMKQGLPVDFEEDGVQVMFNVESGYVFLTNSEYQAALIHNGQLKSYYTCAECGQAGFGYTFEKNVNCEGCRAIADNFKEANR